MFFITPAVEKLASDCGMTVLSFRKIAGVLERQATNELTSAQLAFCLGITRRSAVRMLSRMEQGGAAQLCGAGQGGGRGRPCKRYRIWL